MQRRQFLAAASATTLVTRSQLAGKQAASERIQVGCVGVGGRAGFLLRAFAGQKDVDIVAVADIDSRRLPAAVEAVKQINGRAPTTHGDFRHLIDNPQIDVLVVGTPDHWHAIPSILACQAGKDVYVEKPDGHNMEEGKRMVAAQRKHKRVVQMGTQSRTSQHFQEAIDYIKTGALGTVLAAKAWESAKQGSIGFPQDSAPPDGVDYDMWLGPAPQRDFNPRRFHGNWRWFFDYGSGDLGNDGVHRIDFARWALSTAVEAGGGAPLGMPTRVSAMGGKWYFDDMQEWPDTLQCNYEYAGAEGKPGCLLTYEMKIWTPYNYYDEGEGAIVYGDQGYIILGNRRWRAYQGRHELVAEGSGSNDGTSHIRNFLDCVKSRQRPNADLETVGHPTSVLCHAANVAWKIGRQVQLDTETELFVGDDEANRMRSREEYRKPWELPEV
jgi:predicted dehydrogenase